MNSSSESISLDETESELGLRHYSDEQTLSFANSTDLELVFEKPRYVRRNEN
jgi:hypothetical protein